MHVCLPLPCIVSYSCWKVKSGKVVVQENSLPERGTVTVLYTTSHFIQRQKQNVAHMPCVTTIFQDTYTERS